VAETIRAYGDNFWRALPLGLPFAVTWQLIVGLEINAQILVLWLAAPFFSAAFAAACVLVLRLRRERRELLRAWAIGILVWLPAPVLLRAFLLPALAWLAFFGLAVPASLVEGLGVRAALRRARRLATADYVHTLGSICTLVLVVFVSAGALFALLHGQAETAARVSSFLALVVLSPLLYLGAALLYLDEAARVGSRTRRRDADLHPPVDADAAGRPDAQVEP
jgi:phosphate/sulfate permease